MREAPLQGPAEASTPATSQHLLWSEGPAVWCVLSVAFATCCHCPGPLARFHLLLCIAEARERPSPKLLRLGSAYREPRAVVRGRARERMYQVLMDRHRARHDQRESPPPHQASEEPLDSDVERPRSAPTTGVLDTERHRTHGRRSKAGRADPKRRPGGGPLPRPSHNNLGVLLLARGELSEAANELE